jgi:hypothetical protein
MAAKKQKKSGTTKARPKMGVLKKPPTKLAKVADYLSAQATSPSGPKMATEALDLKAKRDAYVTAQNAAVTARAVADQADLDAADAEDDLDTSIGTYVRKGGVVAAGDAAVLTSLAIDVAAARGPQAEGPAPAPLNVALLMGSDSGQGKLKWARPAGVGAFVAQYRLKPTSPNTPPGEWLPPEGYATNKVEWLIDGVPPAALLRARVRSIGAEIGEWSVEVLGKAR